MKPWSEAEDALLRQRYGSEGGPACVALLPGRKLSQVYRRAGQLGLLGDPLWTAAEEQLLREHYVKLGPQGVQAMMPARTLSGIGTKAKRLGLRFKPPAWTAEEDDTLRRLYPQGGSAPVAQATGREPKAVSERAKRLGVRCLDTGIASKTRWARQRANLAPQDTRLTFRKRKPAPVWPRLIDQPQACAEPIRTEHTRVTVAPPVPERWAVAEVPRVVDAADCRPWARLVAEPRA